MSEHPPMAAAMARLGTESAFEMLARARALEAQGRSIIHLEIGEPDFDTPAHVVEAGVAALRAGKTHYGPAAGLPELREAVAAEVSRTRGITVSPDEVVVTPGAKPIIFYSIVALLSPGDEAIYPSPGFPIYESVIRYVGATPVPLTLSEERDFRIDIDELRAKLTPRTRLLILCSPSNPTGGVLTPADLAAIADLVHGRDIMILADEIYSRILYDGHSHSSIAAQPGQRDKTIILDGFSKTYAMTGWRLGYGVMPRSLADAMTLLMINTNSCTATFTQLAGVAALTGPQDAVAAMVAEFAERRALVVDGLNAIPGLRCTSPQGAFYAFPNIKSYGMTAKQMADYLLTEAGVACLSGAGFGAAGEGYLRLSYATSRANLTEALARIAAALAKLS